MKRNDIHIAHNLIQKLWNAYIKRVPYARKYFGLIERKGGTPVIDHLAFRTLNTHTGEQPEGITAIRHIIMCFGYQKAGTYKFPKKKLTAVHFEHPDKLLPGIFVSQAEVEQLPSWVQQLINEAVNETPYLLPDNGIELLNRLNREGVLTSEAANVLEDELFTYFRRAWHAPGKETVLKVNDVSHYAAWVLLHGNAVSHFAALINEQGIANWPDLETTCNALDESGFPAMEMIEGNRGSILQQAATKAVKEDVEVKSGDVPETIKWTYAYFELVQRGVIEENGQEKLFSGFLTEQSRRLFNMTQTLDN